jgi:ABC-type branched-subunit amino acid transport system ATPase component/ABC-type branched-subunit amino acid transport system permease subunit
MTSAIEFALLGLGAGAVYVLLANGLIVIYRGSGILNFAHGAFAMAGAFLFYEMHVNSGYPFALAFILSLLAVGALGCLTQISIMGPMRRSSGLMRLIATLGVLGLMQGIAVAIYGDNDILMPFSLPNSPLRFGKFVMPESQLWLLAIAGLVSVGLYLLSQRTLFGLATTAAAENETAVAFLGWSPNALATVTWSVGAMLAATAGILLVPMAGLNAGNLVLIVVPAMAVALVGGFSSFWLALAAGLAMGILQSECTGLFPGVVGLADALPLCVIIAVLVVRGRSLPVRGHVLERLPRVGAGLVRPRRVATVALVLAIALFVFPQGLTAAVTVQMIEAVILLSIVVITGYAGQVSLAPLALAGTGALLAGQLVASQHWPLLFAMIAGTIGAGLVGVLFGLPALRTRGTNLAVVTLGLGLAVYEVVFVNPSFTGGPSGLQVGGARLFGLNIDPDTYPARYAVFCLACLVLVGVAVANLRRGRAGRRLLAVRSNERAAASLGVSVMGTKLWGFGISSAVAGLGGILLGFQSHSVILDGFDPITAINSVMWAVVGGIGYVTGALFGSGFTLGGVGSYALDQFGSLDEWLVIAGAASVLLILVANPDGIARAAEEGRLDPVTRFLVAKVRAWRASSAAAQTRASAATAGTAVAFASLPRQPIKAGSERKTLVVDTASVRFGGVRALRDASLSVEPARIVGLIGPNGAGKTTMIDAITGYVPMTGMVRLDDQPLDGLTARQRARAGVTRTFQSVELFEDLTVRENLQVAEDRGDNRAFLSNLIRPERERLSAATADVVDLLGISDYLEKLPGELSQGTRRLVGMARAMATQPVILLLDEPTAGLDDEETSRIAGHIQQLAASRGTGILLVEHDMRLVMSISDRVIVFDFGEKIADGAPDLVCRDPRVISAYLGAMDVAPPRSVTQGSPHEEAVQ